MATQVRAARPNDVSGIELSWIYFWQWLSSKMADKMIIGERWSPKVIQNQTRIFSFSKFSYVCFNIYAWRDKCITFLCGKCQKSKKHLCIA